LLCCMTFAVFGGACYWLFDDKLPQSLHFV
jgi:hypothetical protein